MVGKPLMYKVWRSLWGYALASFLLNRPPIPVANLEGQLCEIDATVRRMPLGLGIV